MRALVGTVVALGLVVGGAVVVDGVARDQAEDRIAQELTGLAGVEGQPDVTIGGVPFLTQLAGGRLTSVVVTTDAATVSGLRLEDVEVRFLEVSTSTPYIARRAELTALARPDALAAVLGVADLGLGVRQGELVATTTVLGLPLDVVLVPTADGRAVVVDVTGFVLGGVGVAAEDLPAGVADQLRGLRFDVDGLPAGMALTGVAVVPDGLELTAAGGDLVLTG